MICRGATRDDVAALTEIWHEGWHFGHAATSPASLTQLRTREDFERRLVKYLTDTLVGADDTGILGFAILNGDEIYQFYVASAARGKGVAAALMRAVEDHMRDRGVQSAWLDVNPGNARALAFYRRAGWSEGPLREIELETSQGPYMLPCIKMEKAL